MVNVLFKYFWYNIFGGSPPTFHKTIAQPPCLLPVTHTIPNGWASPLQQNDKSWADQLRSSTTTCPTTARPALLRNPCSTQPMQKCIAPTPSFAPILSAALCKDPCYKRTKKRSRMCAPQASRWIPTSITTHLGCPALRSPSPNAGIFWWKVAGGGGALPCESFVFFFPLLIFQLHL